MTFDITTLTNTSFCFFDIDDTAYVVFSKEVETTDGARVLTTLSELGETPSVYDICKKDEYSAHIRIPEVIKAFLVKEYRLVSLTDETVSLDAYKSKNFDNRLRTFPFHIDTKEEVFNAELLKVYETMEDNNFYRFIVFDQKNRIVLASGLYPNPEVYSIGKIFEMLLREFIRVVRVSRNTHSSYMDNWHFNLK